MNVQGIAQGSTSVVVKDNATPPNKVTISITVIPKTVFTTAGKISFSSNKGDFSVNGIFAENFITAAANSEGAGGQIIIELSSSFGYIIGYKKKSQNIIDIVSIVFVKKTLSQGTLAIDSSRNLGYDTAVVSIAFGADLNSQTPDSYVLHTGSLTFSVLNTQKATGTFSGAGTLIRNNVPVAGNTVSVTNGMFDVPLLVEDFGLANKSAEQERILGFAKKLIEKDLMKMKLNRE